MSRVCPRLSLLPRLSFLPRLSLLFFWAPLLFVPPGCNSQEFGVPLPEAEATVVEKALSWDEIQCRASSSSQIQYVSVFCFTLHCVMHPPPHSSSTFPCFVFRFYLYVCREILSLDWDSSVFVPWGWVPFRAYICVCVCVCVYIFLSIYLSNYLSIYMGRGLALHLLICWLIMLNKHNYNILITTSSCHSCSRLYV